MRIKKEAPGALPFFAVYDEEGIRLPQLFFFVTGRRYSRRASFFRSKGMRGYRYPLPTSGFAVTISVSVIAIPAAKPHQSHSHISTSSSIRHSLVA